MKQISIFYILILFSTTLFSQNKEFVSYTDVPLDTVILELQKKFDVIISYNSKITESKKVTLNKVPLTLSKILSEIENQTKLVFVKIDARNYALQIKETPTQICGYVFDNKTKEKLLNVSVFQTKTPIGTITNDDGYFELINLTTKNDIHVRFLGYEKQIIPLDNFESGKCISFYLEEETFSLNEIVLSEYLTKGFYKNKDGSIEATPNKFQVLPELIEPDILQSAQLIPGIQSPDETATGLNIRGGTPDQNLILWDGIKMYQYDHFFGMISSFNPYIVEDVKLFKNAASARYRSHLSGVIDIQSHSKIPKKTEAGIGMNMIYTDGYIKTPISDNVGIILSARRSFSDVIETVTFDEFSEQIFQNTRITDTDETFSDALSKTNNTFYFIDFTAKVIAKLKDESMLTISSIYSKNELNFESQFDEINQRTNDELDINNKGLSANWEKNWGDGFKTKVNSTISNYQFNYLGQELLLDLFDYETLKQNDVLDVGLLVQADYKINEKHLLVSGYNFAFNELSYAIANTSDVIFNDDFLISSQNTKNATHSLFGEHHYKSDNWFVNTGLRANYFTNISKFFLEPRVHVSRKINNHINATLSAEKQYQSVSQVIEFETQNFGLENQVWVLANNQGIPLLESEQVSIGANFKKNDWYLDIDTYYKKIRNLTSITKGFNRRSIGFSIGQSSILGVDVLLKKKIQNFTSLISYSLTRNNFDFGDLNNQESFPGNFDIRHYLSLIQSLRLKNIELSLGWKFRTPRPYTPANGLIGDNASNIAIDYGPINSQQLNIYHRLDLSATYKFKLFSSNQVNTIFGFSLLNVYNNKSVLNRTYRIIIDEKNVTYQLRETDKISLGRTPNFIFRLEF
ncbi:MAG: TonB-dependent receptor [Flavobacteriaceae bacterium]